MSATDEVTALPDDPFPEEPEQLPEAGKSLIDALRTQRQQLQAGRSIDLDVPGWGGKLSLRMGPVEPRRMTSLLGKAQRGAANPEVAEGYNADLIALATQEVIGHHPDGSSAVLADEHGPVGIDSRLADLLGIEATNARQVVYAIFAGANDRAIALGTFAQKWLDWAQGSDEEVDDEFVGESSRSALS